MQTKFVFPDAVNLVDLIGVGFVTDVIHEETVHKLLKTASNSLVVLSRKDVLEFLANNIRGMSLDIAKWAQDEQYFADIPPLVSTVQEMTEALEEIQKSTAQYFYIVP